MSFLPTRAVAPVSFGGYRQRTNLLLSLLSAGRRAAAFDTFKADGARSLKMMPGHHFETFKDLAPEGTTFKPRVPPCVRPT